MSNTRWATISNGTVGEPRPYSEREPGSVKIHNAVQMGDRTLDGGITFHRDGKLLEDPGYAIPVGDLFRELTDQELQQICALILTGPETSRVPTFAFLFRAVAQTELSSVDPRVVAARVAFEPLLGADRIEHLFRQR